MKMIKFLNEIKEPKVSELGGKGYSLVALINNGFKVPNGFILPSEGFFKFLRENNLIEKIERLATSINENNVQHISNKIKNLILNGEMPKYITFEIKDSLTKIKTKYVAVRSSAIGEDNLTASFAGLYDTFLNVETKSSFVIECVKKCWVSLFNKRAIVYRIKKGLSLFDGMAVIVQEMIPSKVSGITFTIHPTNEKALLIEASYGLGDLIVSGKINPDEFILSRDPLNITMSNIS